MMRTNDHTHTRKRMHSKLARSSHRAVVGGVNEPHKRKHSIKLRYHLPRNTQERSISTAALTFIILLGL
jgi:hypothetical protein